MTETVTVNFSPVTVCTIVEPVPLYENGGTDTFTSVTVKETSKFVNFSTFTTNPTSGCPDIQYRFKTAADSDFDPILGTHYTTSNPGGNWISFEKFEQYNIGTGYPLTVKMELEVYFIDTPTVIEVTKPFEFIVDVDCS